MNYDKVSRLSSKLKVFCEIMKRNSEKRDIQGNFSNSGVPTSRRIQETMSERPKRPQQASLADFLEIPEATDEQRPQVSDAQHDAKQDIGSLSSVCRETPSHSLQQEHRTRWSRLGSKITSLADCQDILLTVSMLGSVGNVQFLCIHARNLLEFILFYFVLFYFLGLL